MAAALAALAPAAFADTARRATSLVEARERLAARLREVRDVRHVYPSRGNFLLLRMDDAEAAWRRLRAAGIAVRDVRHMPFLDDALRVTVGTEAQNAALLAAMDAPDGRGGA